MKAHPSAQLLHGKTAFITGGARGIGLAVAKAYQRYGANVIIADLLATDLEQALSQLDRASAQAIVLDVTSESETALALAECVKRFRQVDIVVPNAGVLVLKKALDIDVSQFRQVLEVNLIGAFITATVFGRHMVSRGEGGAIILTSSLFGLRGGAQNAAYSASKFGMIGLAQSLAAELASDNIRVNCVCPGQMDTRMIRQLFDDRAASQATTAQAIRSAFENRIPLGQLGSLTDLAGTYVYLASELSAYVTGQSIVVDGGWQVG